MPVKKGKGCVAKVMREWKAGTLQSGKGGEPVKDQEQAVAIALSMCGKSKPKGASYEELASKLLAEIKSMPQKSPDQFDLAERPFGRAANPFIPGRMGIIAPKFQDGCGCGPKCGCRSCMSKYGEGGLQMQAALGYPTPQFDEEGGAPELDEIMAMLMDRLQVIHGLTSEIEQAIMAATAGGGEVEMERWVQDKITLAADYLSAAANQVMYGNGLTVEMDDEEEVDEGESQYGRVYGGGGYPGYAEGKG
jgi:hypothetical protein